LITLAEIATSTGAASAFSTLSQQALFMNMLVSPPHPRKFSKTPVLPLCLIHAGTIETAVISPASTSGTVPPEKTLAAISVTSQSSPTGGLKSKKSPTPAAAKGTIVVNTLAISYLLKKKVMNNDVYFFRSSFNHHFKNTV
jgi:hypothetical protein